MFDKLKDQLQKLNDYFEVSQKYQQKVLENEAKRIGKAGDLEAARQSLQDKAIAQDEKLAQKEAELYRQQQEEFGMLSRTLESFTETLSGISQNTEETTAGLRDAASITAGSFESANEVLKEISQFEFDDTRAGVEDYKTLRSLSTEALDDLIKGGTGLAQMISEIRNQLSLLPEELRVGLSQESFGEGLSRQAMQSTGAEEYLSQFGFEGLTGTAAASVLSSIEDIQEQMRKIEFAEGLIADTDELRKGFFGLSSSVKKLNENVDVTKRNIADLAKNATKSFKDVGSSIKDALDFEIFGTRASTLLAGLFIKNFAEITNQTQELARQIGGTRLQAEELRDSMTAMGVSLRDSSGALLTNQRSVLEALMQLNKEFGSVVMGQEDLVQGQIDLVKGFKLQEDVAVRIGKLAFANQTTTKDVTKEVIEQTRTLARQRGIFFDVRSILTEVAGLSADIRAQLGFSAQAISQAVVDARKFGTNINTVAKAAAGLLDFEQSIGAELQAQLITGRAINLNQARFNALNGDLSGVVKEIAKQMGSMEEFGRLNVIQQQSLAQAFGMSAAELSSMVEEYYILDRLGVENIKQLEEQNRLNDLLLEQGGERLYNQYLQQSAADRFTQTMQRLETILVDIVEGPIGLLAEGLANILNSAVGFGAVMGVLTGAAVLTGISALVGAATSLAAALGASAASVLLITGGLAAVGAAVGAGIYNYSQSGNIFSSTPQEVKDGIAPASNGPFTITDSKGAMAVTAVGDGIIASPNISNINNSYQSAQMDSKFDQIISTNRELIAAVEQNTKVSRDNANFLAKAKQNLVVGATDLGTQLNVHSYRVQYGAWAILLIQSGLGMLM